MRFNLSVCTLSAASAVIDAYVTVDTLVVFVPYTYLLTYCRFYWQWVFMTFEAACNPSPSGFNVG